MSLVLQDVRKAYELLADYQQRIVELLDFIKNELGAEHYYHNLPNSISSQSIPKIYTLNNVGIKLLPMLDMELLWHKTLNVPEDEWWQDYILPNDLVFDIIVKTNDSDDTSSLHLYVYQCIKYTKKYNWYEDVWNQSYEYPVFNTVGNYKNDSDTIEYQIYGEKIDLSQLSNEQMTKKALEEFRKNASEKLGCVV